MINMRWLAKVVIAALIVASTSGGCRKNTTDSGPDPDPEFARVPQRPENTESPHALGEDLSKSPGVSIKRVEREVVDGVEFGTTFTGRPGRKWELEGELMANLESVYPGEIRVLQETAIPDGTYRIIGKVPDEVFPGEDDVDITRIDWEPVYEAIRDAYVATFGLRIAEEARTIDVYTLTAPNGKPEAFVPSTPDENGVYWGNWGTDFQHGIRGCRFGSKSMSELAWWLESQLGVYVVDETELTGHYDFFVGIWPFITERPTVKQAMTALKEVGLSLQPAQREVKFLVIGPNKNQSVTP